MSEQLFRHQENEHNIDLDEYWEQDEKIVQEILKDGAQSYLKNLENTENEELQGERTCSCIDERVKGLKFAIPGSGILLGEEKALELLRKAGVTTISSHEDCGAANIAFEKLSPEKKEYYKTADEYAREFTENLARKLKIAYGGHKQVETPKLHTARVIYYDASGNFLADKDGLPKGFTIDHKFSSNDDAKASLELAIKIAMGDHGFGNKFNESSPLLIIPIGGKKVLEKLREEILEVMQKDDSWKNRIKLDEGIRVRSRKKVKSHKREKVSA